jgi:hypothetical protein
MKTLLAIFIALVTVAASVILVIELFRKYEE